MKPEEINAFRQILPDAMPFPYFPGREAAWLLSEHMPDKAGIAALRKTDAARFLNKLPVREAVANSGGTLCRADILPVATAGEALATSRAAEAALGATMVEPWLEYPLSFGEWAKGRDCYWQQTSRTGGNLVLQINFPYQHALLYDRYLRREERWKFEWPSHPVRTEGPITMAWVRLDIDLDNRVALIEEVQSDWFRSVGSEYDRLKQDRPQSRELRKLELYRDELRKRFARDWDRIALFAALWVLRSEFDCREVFYHQWAPGAALKGIAGRLPPRSLYASLPKSFGFRPTRDTPAFLERPRRKVLRALRRKPGPLFWKLEFTGPG